MWASDFAISWHAGAGVFEEKVGGFDGDDDLTLRDIRVGSFSELFYSFIELFLKVIFGKEQGNESE